jgi:hypothetical protein
MHTNFIPANFPYPVSRKKNSRQWARLRILCSTGLPLMTLVPDAFSLVRELIPNSAAQLFLQADSAERRLAGQGQEEADPIQALPPPNGYYFSDSEDLGPLRPQDYKFSLERTLERGSEVYGKVTLYRKQGPNFDIDDAEDLGRVATYFEYALRNASQPAAGLSGVIEDEAMLLATTSGEILFLSDSARALLDQLASQEEQRFDRQMLPPFCQRLVESVVYGDRYPWRLPSCTLALAGGALEARAQWMSAGGMSLASTLDAGHSRTIGIFLKFVVPMPLRIWRALNTVELSPQQMEVAYWMGVGGGREAARARMDVSDAVLRDCVKAVYEKFGCTSEAGLLAILRPAVSRM